MPSNEYKLTKNYCLLLKFLRTPFLRIVYLRDFLLFQIYIRSSDADRTLASAQAVVMGMFSAKESINSTSWLPIPIHATSPGFPDPYCKVTAIDCPLQHRLEDETNKDEGNTYNEQYKELFKFLENATGIENFNFEDADSIYNIQREIWNGLVDKQPSWINQTWPQYNNRTTMDIIIELNNHLSLNQANSFEKSKALTGLTLYNWLQNMMQATEGKAKQKMLLFSSHDGTLSSFLYSLIVANGLTVPYSAAIIMEVYSDDNSSRSQVELYYRNETHSNSPFRLYFPECYDSCYVDSLMGIYKNSVLESLDDMYQYCESNLTACNPTPKASKSARSQTSIIGIVLSTIFISILYVQ
ncbi:hypothetical protein WR25_01333 [Diploscapter pachys]|uniref:Acid phosphatase n=1 Tax=Diploscapter pachys TaxID=2018661 RepID=A0A2A2J9U0_9BILA|nr:hypothetical protein WR25_01333 [Diploscapter pachys]